MEEHSYRLPGWGSGASLYVTIEEMQSSRAGKLEDLHDASMAETVACWKAIEAVVFHGIPRVQLETDSMLLQKAVQTIEMEHAPAGIIFQDIRSLIWENFFHFECLHVPPVCNSSAHEIASLGMSWCVGSSKI